MENGQMSALYVETRTISYSRLLLKVLLIGFIVLVITFLTLSQIYTDDSVVNDSDLYLEDIAVLPQEENAYYLLPDFDNLSIHEKGSFDKAVDFYTNIDDFRAIDVDGAIDAIKGTEDLTDAFIEASSVGNYQCPSLVNNYSPEEKLCDLKHVRYLSFVTALRAVVEASEVGSDTALDTSLSIVRLGFSVKNAEHPHYIESIIGADLIRTGLQSIVRTIENSSQINHVTLVQTSFELEGYILDGKSSEAAAQRNYLVSKASLEPFKDNDNFYWHYSETVNQIAETARVQKAIETAECGIELEKEKMAAAESGKSLRTPLDFSLIYTQNAAGKVVHQRFVDSLHIVRESECELNQLNKVTQKIIIDYISSLGPEFLKHAQLLYLLLDPDRDNDGLVDSMEILVYLTDPTVFSSQTLGISDSEHVYNLYETAIETGDEGTIQAFKERYLEFDDHVLSLDDQFSKRGIEIYNPYVGMSDSVEEILQSSQKLKAENKIQESIVLLQNYLSEHPDNPLVLYNLGRAYHKLRDFDKALVIYMDLLDNPVMKGPLLYSDIATANLGSGNEALYEDYYLRSIEEFPEELGQYIFLASHYERENRLDDAIVIINKGIEVEPRYASYYNILAIIAGKRNNHVEELRLQKESIKYDFAYSTAHFNISLIYGQEFSDDYDGYTPDENDLRKALVEARIASELNPSERYSSSLTLLYSRLGETSKAKEIESNLTESNTLGAAALNDLGLLHYGKKDYEEAEYYYLEAIDNDPGLKNPYNNLGNLYSSIGEFNKSLQYYKKAIELDPLYFNPHFNIGSLYMNRWFKDKISNGDLLESKKWFEKAIEIDQTKPGAYQSLGRVYLKLATNDQSNLIQAEKYLLISIGLEYEDWLSHAELGYAYYHMEKYPEAKSEWEKAKSLGFENSETNKLLLEI